MRDALRKADGGNSFVLCNALHASGYEHVFPPSYTTTHISQSVLFLPHHHRRPLDVPASGKYGGTNGTEYAATAIPSGIPLYLLPVRRRCHRR